MLVLGVLAVLYRPLLFASTDPDVALARGVPVRLLSLVFAVLIGLTTALAVPIVGAILVLAVMIAPGAAAARVTANPVLATVLAVLFAEVALLGGTVLSLAPGLPVSGYVAAIAFLCYLGCRVVARLAPDVIMSDQDASGARRRGVESGRRPGRPRRACGCAGCCTRSSDGSRTAATASTWSPTWPRTGAGATSGTASGCATPTVTVIGDTAVLRCTAARHGRRGRAGTRDVRDADDPDLGPNPGRLALPGRARRSARLSTS